MQHPLLFPWEDSEEYIEDEAFKRMMGMEVTMGQRRPLG